MRSLGNFHLMFRMDSRRLNFSLNYSNDFETEKLKNKMSKEYRKTIHDMVVINKFMKTNENTTKKLEGMNSFLTIVSS